MGIFASIKNAIWHADRDHAEEKAKPVGDPFPAAPAPAAAPQAAPAPAPATTSPEPISEAAMQDRIAQLPGAGDHNWRTSIVDLMTVVGVDPSYENRRDLAAELGLEGYSGTAEQNIALHHAVLNLLAAEGGAMPDMLRD